MLARTEGEERRASSPQRVIPLGHYTSQGSGVGGGCGSPPSAIKVTAPLDCIAGRLCFPAFKNGTGIAPEKTATAADKTKMANAARVLDFVI